MNGYQRLGDWLVARGHLTENQRDRALEAQTASGARFGEVLLTLGYVGERDIAQCLSEQYDLPLVDLATLSVQREALKLVTPSFALTSLVLPVKVTPHEFHCVIADPLDLPVTDSLTKALGRRLVLQMAGPRELYEKIAISYGLAEAKIKPARRETPEANPPSPETNPRKRRSKVIDQSDRQHLLAALATATGSTWTPLEAGR